MTQIDNSKMLVHIEIVQGLFNPGVLVVTCNPTTWEQRQENPECAGLGGAHLNPNTCET